MRWAEYQVQPPTLHQVDEWWGNGKTYGLALICGSVSGNLEMTEIEGRATSGEHMTEIVNRMDELGVTHIWDMLTGPQGYSEMSPSGGIHLLYRIADHDVPGNTKIARDPDDLVLAETRGRGGYVIVAPTPGVCHPSGEAWAILSGRYGSLPTLTWEERCLLHEALRLALDNPCRITPNSDSSNPGRLASDYAPRAHHAPLLNDDPDPLTPNPVTPRVPAALPVDGSGSSAAGLSPGDQFELDTDWADILEPHGWRLHSRVGHERFWVRPGKDPRDGHSATTGYRDDRDRLFVFSTSTPFEVEQSYTKFGAYAVLNCGGNHHTAAGQLARCYGSSAVSALDTLPRMTVSDDSVRYTQTDDGNAQHLLDWIKDRYVYLAEEKIFLLWDGTQWRQDARGALSYEFRTMCRAKLQEAEQRGDETAAKWWKRSLNASRVDAAIRMMRDNPGVTVIHDELDRDRHLINVANGVYDLQRHELVPHERSLMMTRTMGTEFNPQATCPQFEGFMERVLPDEDMRAYVQRALGYSLLGDADQRSLFLICGPSGTGKSTLMATMELLFGGYGATAPSGTLRATGRESSAPSNDLHTLMGRRFVSTSETNEHTAYNEDLIKRLTGRDKVTSRKLYSEFVEWSPRCTIWLATNHPPRFSSDDDAIWRRAKIVPFNTVLLDDNEIADFAHNVLAQELAGIFNWLLAGLRDYQRGGLREPDEVRRAAHEVRLQSDPVSRFVEDRLTEGVLIRGIENTIRSTELYTMYTEWAKTVGERSLGSRRFTNRLSSSFPDLESTRINGNYFWRGVGKASSIGQWLIRGGDT